jgi:hypothetical protein
MAQHSLPDHHRTARSIQIGYEIHPVYGTWIKVIDRAVANRSITFTLADGTEFHASPSQEIRSRYQPNQQA